MHIHLGIQPISPNHFKRIVVVDGVVVEAIVDTRGTCTLIDLKSATIMELNIELATTNQHLGCYWGPSGRAVHYKSRVRGLVTIRFDSEIVI